MRDEEQTPYKELTDHLICQESELVLHAPNCHITLQCLMKVKLSESGLLSHGSRNPLLIRKLWLILVFLAFVVENLSPVGWESGSFLAGLETQTRDASTLGLAAEQTKKLTGSRSELPVCCVLEVACCVQTASISVLTCVQRLCWLARLVAAVLLGAGCRTHRSPIRLSLSESLICNIRSCLLINARCCLWCWNYYCTTVHDAYSLLSCNSCVIHDMSEPCWARINPITTKSYAITMMLV